VPIHDESKVTAYLRRNHNVQQEEEDTSSSSLLLSTIINEARTSLGAAGMIMLSPRPNEIEVDVLQQLIESSSAPLQNDKSASSIIDNKFTIFLKHNGNQLNFLDNVRPCQNVNICFEYTTHGNIKHNLAQTHIATNGRTSIAIVDPNYYNEEDPVLVASGIATLIDNTGGGAYVLLSPAHDGDDDVGVGDDEMVQLCEELSYLDVVGSTIKSRLVVAALSDDQVEECLGIGISKYIVDDELGLGRLRHVVEAQGKELILGI